MVGPPPISTLFPYPPLCRPRATSPWCRRTKRGRPTCPPLPTSYRLPNVAPSTSTSCSRPSARSSATSWWTNATASNLRASPGTRGLRADTCTTTPEGGRFAIIGFLKTWLYEFIAIEQGGMLQNLGLMTQALGLGGFPHFAAHPFIWFQALGFRMQEIPFSRTIGAGPLTKRVMRDRK